jgi:transposase InsO family protein
MRFEFIDLQKKAYPIRLLCSVLRVSYSGYFSWRKRPVSKNKRKDDLLKALVVDIQKKHRNSCGSRRMAQKISQAGIKIGRYKADKLMKKTGANFVPTKKFKVTTESKHNFPVSPNLVARNFKAKRPNQIWVSDITYLRSNEGWSYLAVVIDLFNREIVGAIIRSRMSRDLVIDALRMAVRNKKPQPGLIFHSDRGSQYCSNEFRKLLAFYKMKSSMSRKGDCWDNAVAESFFASMKKEYIMRATYRTREELKSDVFRYIHMFYNCYRGHSYLGYKSPMQIASNDNLKIAA